ncbi:MAG: VCBS repeat-containing protein [Planctomycetes bacterium]|nr:VCBS repeat-containing protein [Planctomycetota bacterium]
MIAVDLDSDGDLDLVLANEQSNEILTLYQVQSRGFAGIAIPVEAGPASVIAGDIDADGDVDLVTANSGSGDLTILVQDEAGGFAPAAYGPIAAGETPVSVVAADFDDDGDLDLAYADATASEVNVLYQAQDGTFLPDPLGPLMPHAGTTPSSLVAADVDLDGRVDIAASAQTVNGSVSLFRQAFPGFFIRSSSFPLAPGFSSFVKAADLDRDNDLDFLTQRGVFLQDDLGNFWPSGQGIFFFTNCMELADLDNDGDLDLVDPGLRVFHQEPQGVFLQPPFGTPTVSGSGGSVVVADLDGDGTLDLASAGFNDLTIVFQGVSTRYPLPLETVTCSGTSAGGITMDADSDGLSDLICTGFGGLAARYQVAPRRFSDVQVIAESGSGVWSWVAEDLDSNGLVDVAYSVGDDRTLFVAFQESPRVFIPSKQGALTSGCEVSAAADLDDDGDLDLVCVDSNSGDLFVLVQDASRSFATSEQGPIAFDDAPSTVVAADLDGDGDTDLVAAPLFSYTSDTTALTVLLQQDAQLVHSPQGEVRAGLLTWDILASDIDGDGDIDLVSAGLGIEVFVQTSPGRFEPSPQDCDSRGLILSHITAADLDGDGDVDLAALDRTLDPRGLVFRQETRGQFVIEFETSVPASLSPSGPITATDVDGDGDTDIMITGVLLWGGG